MAVFFLLLPLIASYRALSFLGSTTVNLVSTYFNLEKGLETVASTAQAIANSFPVPSVIFKASAM